MQTSGKTPATTAPLLRALRLAVAYPWTVAATLSCTLVVAALWGGNIGGLYPVFQVAMSGKSLQEWNADEIAEGKKTIARIDADITESRKQIKSGKLSPERAKELSQFITVEQVKRDVAQTTVESQEKLRPWLVKYLPSKPFETIVVIIGVLMLAIVVRQICLLISTMLQARMATLMSMHLRKQFFGWLLRTDQATFSEKGASGVMTHMGDIGQVTTGVTSILDSAIREPAKMAACLIGAAMISWRLLVFSLLAAPIAAVLVRMLGKAVRRSSEKQFKIGRDVNKVVYDVLGGLPVVQLYTAEQYEQQRFNSKMKEEFGRRMKAAFYGALSRPLSEILGMGAVCVALLGGTYLVLNNETHIFGIPMCDQPLSLAAVLVFYGLLVGVNDPLRRFGGIYANVQTAIAAANRLFPLLDQPPAITDRENAQPAPSLKQAIRFEDIHFSYNADREVLTDINLEIRAGETVAIIGGNGSGKSTLVNLLARFYDPTQGGVTIDGVDVRDMQLTSLRKKIGYVTQTPVLFTDTVRNNIAYGNPESTLEQIQAAARQAHADEFITSRLSKGYDTPLGAGGVKVSGGEQQRISLARAILRDPELVILDEATSAIDPKSEQLIHQALAGFLKGRTSIMITHKLSSLELADRIVVMEDGRILATGTHEELLASCPTYTALRDSELTRAA